MLANTYRHVAALGWPGRVVAWVLDDADRPEGAAPARSRGSDGDLIAIFDADFVPRRDYPRELVPYFLDPTTAIVQPPQCFDAIKGTPWLQRCAGATQELFHRWIQPSRDRSRAAICVGTCAIHRRSALVEAGGFAQIGHSEDVHTGAKLMKTGYRLRYVPIVVSEGLCPDAVLGSLNQQHRWCTGSMSLLADRSSHADPVFTVRMRISPWSGFVCCVSTGVDIFADAVAVVHVITGRTRERVATGSANTRTTPLAVTIIRVTRITLAVVQTLRWTGMAPATARYGIDHTWAMLGFALLAGCVRLPLLFLRTTTAEQRRAPRSARPALPV